MVPAHKDNSKPDQQKDKKEPSHCSHHACSEEVQQED